MGCGALSRPKIHPSPPTPASLSSVVPSSPGPIGDDEKKVQCAAQIEQENEEVDDGDLDDEDDDSDDTVLGEPPEMAWARAIRRQKKLDRERKRAAKAAKNGTAQEPSQGCADAFRGLRRPLANPDKHGCFDRQCFLISSAYVVNELYDLSINLGKGSFGTVERCAHLKTKQVRAIKTIPKKKIYDKQRMAQEVEVMRLLEHPNILKMYEVFEDSRSLYIIMEMCSGGQLLDKLLLKQTGFEEEAVATLMKQVVGAVNYMHQQRIAHRDLKPENILLMNETSDVANALVKLIDFGFSTRFERGTFMHTTACTSHYVAPDVLSGSYTEACDVWSLGVVLFVLLSGSLPFFAGDEAAIIAKVKGAEYSFNSPPWSNIGEEVKSLISTILVIDAAQRPTAEAVLQHSWIARLATRAEQGSSLRGLLMRMRSFSELGKFQRAALTAVAQQLQEDAIPELREAFEVLDNDGDGCLSMGEFEAGMRLAGLDAPGDAGQMIEGIDTDGSGLVEYTEFLAATIDEKRHLEDAACRSAFQVFDTDRDGNISADDLATMLSCGRLRRSEEAPEKDRAEIERMLAEVDLNGDGQIDFAEFQAMLQTSCKREFPKTGGMTAEPPRTGDSSKPVSAGLTKSNVVPNVASAWQ